MRDPDWALVQYIVPGVHGVRAGVLVGHSVVELPGGLSGESMMALLGRWDSVADVLRQWSPVGSPPVSGAELTAPLTYPGKILCVGANYYSHVEEMGGTVPDPDGEPFFFSKPPTTTVIGPGADIPFPGYPSVRLDWEAELGVVIGLRCKDVAPEQARPCIAGYLAANDLSARDRIARSDAVSPHFVYDWLGQKGQDGFCPLGPGLVPSWQITDPQDLGLRLAVNGIEKQRSSTAEMVIGVDRLVSAASRILTLEPGDVLLTGTPAGVGMPRGEFLAPGDRVVVEIEGIGRLENRVAASAASVDHAPLGPPRTS